jgi:hypothetical protein
MAFIMAFSLWRISGFYSSRYTEEVKRYFSLVAIALLLFVPSLANADRATSTSFILERAVIDAGGELSTSSAFRERSSIGQPAVGISSSTSFILRGGFLYFGVPSVATSAPQPTPSPGPAVQVPAAPGGGGGPFLFPPGEEGVLPPEIIRLCDFNNDNRCNIVDLSIMLFYYEETGAQIARYDLNRSNRVDFPDVSVLMFYWTG